MIFINNLKIKNCEPAGCSILLSHGLPGEPGKLWVPRSAYHRKLVMTCNNHDLQARIFQKNSIIKDVTVITLHFLYIGAGGGWDPGANKYLFVVLNEAGLVFLNYYYDLGHFIKIDQPGLMRD